DPILTIRCPKNQIDAWLPVSRTFPRLDIYSVYIFWGLGWKVKECGERISTAFLVSGGPKAKFPFTPNQCTAALTRGTSPATMDTGGKEAVRAAVRGARLGLLEGPETNVGQASRLPDPAGKWEACPTKEGCFSSWSIAICSLS